MKKKLIFFLVALIIIVLGIYLNRSYAYIYNKIGQEHLLAVNQTMNYDVIKNSSVSTTFTYVALGDSLTAGVGAQVDNQAWPYLVAENMAEKYGRVKLINLGQPGAKSSDVVSGQLASAISAQPDYVTILIGVNDIHNQVSVGDFIKNISLTIDELKIKTKAQIALVNIPYIGSTQLLYPPYDFYFRSRTQEYNHALEVVCQDKQVICVDLYGPNLKESVGTDFYSTDLFHPSAVGYLSWSKIIYAN